jgi:hypothetical protein
MIQITSPTTKRNKGPNHDGKFFRVLKKLSHRTMQISKFSDRKIRAEVLRGSNLFSDMSFVILFSLIRLLIIWILDLKSNWTVLKKQHRSIVVSQA